VSAAAKSVLKELRALGAEGYRSVLRRHGARDPLFGVKISELKKFQKRFKHDHQLALDLYATGNYDAMYLAGLIADDQKMTKLDLQRWADEAYCPALSESTVAWVAAEGQHGWEMALDWLDSRNPAVAAGGWATLSCVIALKDDPDLDIRALQQLVQRVEKSIADQPDAVRSAMNRFVIALGIYVKSLTGEALETAKRLGTIVVDVGDTACKVPSATDHIGKARTRGAIGKKRKTVKC
jgi:3-methyladenine DNA glycosylase AlkD